MRNLVATQSPTFFKLHTTNPAGSYHRAFTSVKELALEILRDLNKRCTFSLRLTEVEYNEERTAGRKIIQNIKISKNNKGRAV